MASRVTYPLTALYPLATYPQQKDFYDRLLRLISNTNMKIELQATLASTAVITLASAWYYMFKPTAVTQRQKGTSLGEFLVSLEPKPDAE